MNTDDQNKVPAPDADGASDPAAAFRWAADFWDEPAEKGLELVFRDLLIRGTIHIIQGHYESGKTTLMLNMVQWWIAKGWPVFHIDYEMGRRRIRERIKSLPDWEEERPFWEGLWHYDYMPNLQPGLLEEIVALLPPGPPLITFDSYSQAMMYLGREENSATEAGNFWVSELQRARELGATIVVIEQVSKNATSRDRYAGRGSGAKAFGADVIWFVERFEKFTPDRVGKIKLTLQKDREGVLADALGYAVGDGQGHLSVTPIDPPTGVPVDDQAIDTVEAVLIQDGWSTPNAIKQNTEGLGDATIRSALRYLEEHGRVESRPRQGRGGGTEYNVIDNGNTATDVPDLG